MARYTAQLGAVLDETTLLVQLMDAPGRPVVRLRLPGPHGSLGSWDECEEAVVITADEPGPEMTGNVELPDGSMLTAGT